MDEDELDEKERKLRQELKWYDERRRERNTFID